jgi:ankyrin repeat protein
VQQVDNVLSREDGQELLRLCREGRLFEVQSWIAQHKSLRVPPSLRKTPMSVALESGFYTLIELLARSSPPDLLNDALIMAVNQRRRDYIDLLIQHGSNLTSVPFITVLRSWDPKLIRLFLDNGADAISDAPFSQAFRERIRTALRPFVEYRNHHPELAPILQEHLDRGLRHAADKGDLKWVSLLLWAGADPRSKGPKDEDDDEESYTTALEEACYLDDPAVLKRLKPDPTRDNLAEFLRNAAHFSRKELVQYLLDLGAPVNDKPNGGCSAVDATLWHLSFEDIRAFMERRLATRWGVWKTMDTLKLLSKRRNLGTRQGTAHGLTQEPVKSRTRRHHRPLQALAAPPTRGQADTPRIPQSPATQGAPRPSAPGTLASWPGRSQQSPHR